MTEQPANKEAPLLNLGTICSRLGFNVTAQFLEQVLCVPPAGTEKAAKLYTEADWATICRRLRAHITTLPRPEIPPPGGWTGVADADQVLSLLNGLDVDTTADDAAIEQAMALVRGLAIKSCAGGNASNKPKALDDPELQELFMSTIMGAMAFGYQGVNPPPPGHWLQAAWDAGKHQALSLVDLQDLPARLLQQREIVRDDAGFYWHPDLPLCDENVNFLDLLEALGIEAQFVSLPSDDGENHGDAEGFRSMVLAWNPDPPARIRHAAKAVLR